MDNISGLSKFPFKSFQELREAAIKRTIYLGLDRTFAREWMARGQQSPAFWKVISYILHMVPYAVFLSLIAFAIIIGKPLLMLVLIPLLFSFPCLVPSSPLRGLVNIISFIFIAIFFITLISRIFTITFIVAPFIIIWVSSKLLYNLSVRQLGKASIESEQLFCFLYKNRILTILFKETGDVLVAEYPDQKSEL